MLGAAFVERTVTSYLVGPGILGVASGSILMIVAALLHPRAGGCRCFGRPASRRAAA